MIIDNTVFVANNEALPAGDLGSILTTYIKDHEPDILSKLLGYQLYKEFDAGFNEAIQDQKWIDLATGSDYTYNGVLKRFKGAKIISRNYVYYKYILENSAMSSIVGIKRTTSENSQFASPAYKQSYALNGIERVNLQLREFIPSINSLTPDTYENYIAGVYETGNVWNL